MGEIERYACENVNKLLVGNKCGAFARERSVCVCVVGDFVVACVRFAG
jgi:hypothetical protein